MKKRLISVIIFLLVQFCLVRVSLAQEAVTFDEIIMNKIQKGDFKKLFNYFYMPKDYRVQDIENDREALTLGLAELIDKELGSFDNFLGVEYLPEWLIVMSLNSGTPKTLEQLLPECKSYTYKVNFSKSDPGYIKVWVYEVGSEPFLLKLDVGLEYNQNSMRTYNHFFGFMKTIAEKQAKAQGESVKSILKSR